MRFVVEDLLNVSEDWAVIPRFAELTGDLTPQILEEAGKFAVQTLAPLNAPGDLQGCAFNAGAVTAPVGFADAYRRYCEAGWPALACDPECGGQGLPQVLNAALYEMLYATNHAWTMYPGLAHGAYECLRAHAPEHLKAVYLPKIVSGEWLSTMCLTEPQAGSDVGLIRTRAEPQADGSYAISGSKNFISGGEHDMTDNIVHLVLARLPDAPVGTRGISLFLVPKTLTEGPNPGSNGVSCSGIEKKMGIKGSATCVMTFAAAKGWMLGDANRGLAAMFVMMNSARLYVGLQGLGHAENAYQNAARYASERVQMRVAARPPSSATLPASGADPIILQPAIRKILMTLRAFVEGERALGYWAAHLLDVAEFHPAAERRAWAHDLVSLLTPIIKSFFTENGFTLSSTALQVWGGYGYLHDFGIEQALRDSRIAMIYEGTNEIQAIDLLVRKVVADRGEKFAVLLDWVRDEARACQGLEQCERFGTVLLKLLDDVTRVTTELVEESAGNPEIAQRVSGDFMRLSGLLLLGGQWARAARVATPHAADEFYRGKIDTAAYFFDYLLPEAGHRLALLGLRDAPLPWINPAAG